MAKAAGKKTRAGADARKSFLGSKLLVGKFYMERIMPEQALRKTRIETGCGITMMDWPKSILSLHRPNEER